MLTNMHVLSMRSFHEYEIYMDPLEEVDLALRLLAEEEAAIPKKNRGTNQQTDTQMLLKL